MKRITLVTGGCRSGKSSFALRLAGPYSKKAFIATAEPFDREMSERIARHKHDRDPAIFTIEEPLDPAAAIRSLPTEVDVAIVDCLTVWVGNLLHHGSHAESVAIPAFLDALAAATCDSILVTNETGMGIVPVNEVSREFRDIAGVLNQRCAAIASDVILMVSGIPVCVKKDGKRTSFP